MKNVNWLVRKIFYRHKSTSLKQLLTEKPPRNPLSEEEQKISLPHDSLYYDVLYIQQQHANLCVDASEAMVYSFFDRPIYSLNKNPRGIIEDKTTPGQGFEEKSVAIEELGQMLQEKGPIIIYLSAKYGVLHAVTCLGYTKDHFIYHDPLEKSNKCISFEELKKITPDNKLFIAFYTGPGSGINHVKLRQIEPAIDRPVKTLKVKPNHAKFFTLSKNKLYDPCQAVIDFLDDYANSCRIFHPTRKHRKAVNDLLESVKTLRSEGSLTPQGLVALIDDLTLSQQVKEGSSLDRRIKTIKTFIPH